MRKPRLEVPMSQSRWMALFSMQMLNQDTELLPLDAVRHAVQAWHRSGGLDPIAAARRLAVRPALRAA